MWGAIIGGAASLLGGMMSSNAAGQNANAATNVAQMELNATAPLGLNTGFGKNWYSSNGLSGGSLSAPYQTAENRMLGNEDMFSNNLTSLGSTGGVNPLLAQAYAQYQNSVPNASLSGVPNYLPSAFFGNGQGYLDLANGGQGLAAQYLGQAANPTQIANNGFGAQLTGAGSGLLSQYAGYNPQQAAAQYAGNLNALQAPQQAVAAQSLAQQLFNSGNLGSTGGANQLQALETSQGLQQTANNVAGQQYGYQNQLGMLGMANQMGASGTNLDQSYAALNSQLVNNAVSQYGNVLGNSLNTGLFGQNALWNQSNTAYARGDQLATQQFAQQQQNAQNGFQAALGLNNAGLGNLSTYGNISQGMLGGAQSIDQSLLNQIALGANIGAARTGAAISAGNTQLQGQIAANNANANMYNGLFSAIGNVNWGSLFGGGGGSMGGTGYGSMANQYGYNYVDDGSGY